MPTGSNVTHVSRQAVSCAQNPKGTTSFSGHMCLLPPFCATRIREDGYVNEAQKQITAKRVRRRMAPYTWSGFRVRENAIANATLLVHPLSSAPTEIWCDASNTAIGAVLIQLQSGLWKPLSCWSKHLNKAQRGYSATDRLIAVSYAVDTFRSYLEGQPIVVRTDHLPLVGSLTKKADTALPMLRRHLLKIAQFVDQLHYLKGERNVIADALSRITLTPNKCNVVHPIYTTRGWHTTRWNGMT